jgi:hypothetical protein
MVNGDTCYVRIQHTTILSEWEISLGTLSGSTLTRTFDARSTSPTGAIMNFSGGEKYVSSVMGAKQSVTIENDGIIRTGAQIATSVTTGVTPNGKVSIIQGDATHPGYLAIYKPDGTRLGYIGFNDGKMSYNADSVLHEFTTGSVVMLGGLTVTGALTGSTATLSGSITTAGVTNSGNFITNGGYVMIDRTGDAASAYLYFRSDDGSTAGYYLQTGTLSRWTLYKSATAEAGANAGSDFILQAYDDAGASLGTALTVTRATRIANFSVSPTAPTATLGDSTTKLATTAFVQTAVTTVAQNSQTGSYTLVLADAGKHIYHPVAAAVATYTIPANATVAFPVGTQIIFINDSVNAVTISIITDTMVLSPGATTGSRTLANGGVARAIKVTTTRWIISGTGLT